MATEKDLEENVHNEIEPLQSQSVFSFEEAIAQTGFGKYNFRILFVCGMILMGVNAENSCMSQIVPSAKCDLNLQTGSLLLSAGFAGSIIGGPIWGYISDNHGRKKVMLFTMWIGFACSLFGSFVQNYTLFVMLRVLNGFLLAASLIIIVPFVGEFHGIRYRAKSIAWTQIFLGLSNAYIPCVAWILIPMNWNLRIEFLDLNYRPWRLVLLLCGLPNFIAAILLIFTPESPQYLYADGKSEKCLRLLQTMYTVNSGKPIDSFQVLELEVPKQKEIYTKNLESSFIVNNLKQLWFNVKPILQGKNGIWTLINCVLHFFSVYMSTGFLMYLPGMLNQRKLFRNEFPDADQTVCPVLDYYRDNVYKNQTISATCVDTVDVYVYKVYLFLTATSMFLFLITGFLLSVVEKKYILVGAYTISCVANVIVGYVENDYFFIILILCILLTITCLPVLKIIVVDIYSIRNRATALSLSHFMARMGAAVGSGTVGYLFRRSCSLAFGAFAIVVLGCILLAATLPKKPKDPNEVKEDIELKNVNGVEQK